MLTKGLRRSDVLINFDRLFPDDRLIEIVCLSEPLCNTVEVELEKKLNQLTEHSIIQSLAGCFM